MPPPVWPTGAPPGGVHVRVPATCANLGPGFDCFGLALALHDDVVVHPTGGPLEVTVDGEGADEVPLGEDNLLVQSMAAGLAHLGADHAAHTLSVRCRNRIPHARGLGSSAAAVVAGLTAARGLVPGGAAQMDDGDLLNLAAGIEGHPDNVAACLYGGVTLAWQETGRARAIREDVNARLAATVLVPATRASTTLARSLLPENVPHADAAANAGRAALLVQALTRRPDLLLVATEDLLHQRYRQSAMPQTLRLVDELRADAVPAVVSGAGPSVLALGTEADRERVRAACPEGWRVLSVPVDHVGVRSWQMPEGE